MNRSYSKIRHIQEVNQRLEKRLVSEQTQTTVTQTGENPGVKTKTTPPMSNPTLPIPNSGTTSGDTTTNPFNNPDLLKKYVGKQFNTYSVISEKNKPDEIGNLYGTFKIEKAYSDITGNNDVVFEIGGGLTPWNAYFNCKYSEQLLIKTSTDYHFWAFAPSLTKELKQTFCTTGARNLSVPKVDYPTP